MDKKIALSLIQKMNNSQTITNEAIIAWYYFYRHKLPKMHPERSDLDLIRTVALWMELTDCGGYPKFPYQYRSSLKLLSIDNLNTLKKRSMCFLVGNGLSILGVIMFFINWKFALVLIIVGQLIDYFAYRLTGGPTNPRLMKEDTKIYKKEGKRVLEWSRKQSTSNE